MLPHRLAVIAPYIRVPQVLLQVVAHCSLANKSLARVGALPTLKKVNKLLRTQRLLRQPIFLVKKLCVLVPIKYGNKISILRGAIFLCV
jgi:hypothetical protein